MISFGGREGGRVYARGQLPPPLATPLVPLYASTDMTSFYYASIPTRGKPVPANQLEHKSNDHTGDTVTSVCVTNEKDTALQRQI